MNLVEGMYWVGWLLAILFFALAVYASWRAWFGDRPRGRRRCPRCWYDLAYTSGMTCSECGHTAQTEAEFSRTRRHILRGLMAMLLAAIVVIAVRERALGNGWASAVPSRVLVAIIPLFDNINNDAVNQLVARMNRNQLDDANLRRLIERCADGDGRAIPGSESWQVKYGVLLNRFRPALAALRTGPDELSELERILLEIPPVIRLTSRKTWPAGSPARVGVRTLNWWPVGSDCRMTITPSFEGAEPVTVIASGVNPPTTDYSFVTPALASGTTSLEFEIATERRTPDVDDGWIPIAARSLSVPVEVVESVASPATPVDSPQHTAIMKRLILGARLWEGGTHSIRFYVAPSLTGIEMFKDVAIGIVAETIHDGEVVMTDHSWWMGGPSLRNREFGSWSDVDMSEVFRDVDLTQGQWTVHVTSDPELALRAGVARHYWDGEFTVPLIVRRNEGDAPEPHWWYDADDID